MGGMSLSLLERVRARRHAVGRRGRGRLDDLRARRWTPGPGWSGGWARAGGSLGRPSGVPAALDLSGRTWLFNSDATRQRGARVRASGSTARRWRTPASTRALPAGAGARLALAAALRGPHRRAQGHRHRGRGAGPAAAGGAAHRARRRATRTTSAELRALCARARRGRARRVRAAAPRASLPDAYADGRRAAVPGPLGGAVGARARSRRWRSARRWWRPGPAAPPSTCGTARTHWWSGGAPGAGGARGGGRAAGRGRRASPAGCATAGLQHRRALHRAGLQRGDRGRARERGRAFVSADATTPRVRRDRRGRVVEHARAPAALPALARARGRGRARQRLGGGQRLERRLRRGGARRRPRGPRCWSRARTSATGGR